MFDLIGRRNVACCNANRVSEFFIPTDLRYKGGYLELSWTPLYNIRVALLQLILKAKVSQCTSVNISVWRPISLV